MSFGIYLSQPTVAPRAPLYQRLGTPPPYQCLTLRAIIVWECREGQAGEDTDSCFNQVVRQFTGGTRVFGHPDSDAVVQHLGLTLGPIDWGRR